MAGYRFKTTQQKWTAASRIGVYSKNIPGLNKRFNYHSHEVRYTAGRNFLDRFYQANRKVFTTPENSVLIMLFNTSDRKYGMRGGPAAGAGNRQ